MIISARRNEIFDFALPMGVGLVDMGINLTKFLCENRQNLPSEIIFVGSAGLYKEGEILKIYESSVAANIEISSLENRSYSPIEGEIASIVPRGTCKVNSSGTCKVNSSNFITTDQILAHKLFARGYFLENMEFFAVLKVAKKFQIPVYGVFVATNFCDENAHADFLKNHEQAKKELEKYLKQKEII
jgi:purine nucleoside phosphorylase